MDFILVEFAKEDIGLAKIQEVIIASIFLIYLQKMENKMKKITRKELEKKSKEELIELCFKLSKTGVSTNGNYVGHNTKTIIADGNDGMVRG